MELRFGWATEYGAQKFDVSVNDTDFAQLMTERGFREGLLATVTLLEKFRVLEAYGRYLSEGESLRVLTDDGARSAASTRTQEARQQLDAVVQGIQARLGVTPGEQPSA